MGTNRNPEFAWEKRDCSVIALSNVLGVEYAKAHEMLKAEGRRPKFGTYHIQVENAVKKAGGTCFNVQVNQRPKWHRWHGYIHSNVSLATMLTLLNKDSRYYISIGGKSNGHAVAVVNGILYDNMTNTMMRARVRKVTQVTLPEPPTPSKWGPLTEEQGMDLWERLNRLEGRK